MAAAAAAAVAVAVAVAEAEAEGGAGRRSAAGEGCRRADGGATGWGAIRGETRTWMAEEDEDESSV